MTSLTAFTIVVVLVGLERLAELVVSKRNAAWSLQHGGRETGQGHYPVMVVLHTGFLVVSVMILFGGVLWFWAARYLAADTAAAVQSVGERRGFEPIMPPPKAS